MRGRRLLIACAALVMAAPAPAAARSWHVRAGSTGDGSQAHPFGDLASAERASRRGDRIVVRAGPAVLDGPIRLKPRQRMIGRGRPRIAGRDGDAVVLARRTVVRGLRIVSAGRGAIYGRNVGGVVIRGNDVSGHNTSCTRGFHIPPFNVPTTAPGVGVPISEGLHNGWAAIMVDATRGYRKIVIRGNRVHDADCGDGIDVRAFKRARVRATIARNRVEGLRQGPDFESVLAIGLQTRGRARLVAHIDRNRQAGLGNEGDPPGPEGADSEGVFINPVGPSTLRATVSHNTYEHTAGRGGFSANGLEFVSMGDGADARVTVRDSTFSGTPGDVLEQLGLGTNADLRMRLERVVASGSTGFGGSGVGNTLVIPGNNGDCLLSASAGAGNRVALEVRDSQLTDCANNGLTFGSSVANGEGPTSHLTLDLTGSRLTGNRGNNLRVANATELDHLSVRVEDTDLADARGTTSLTPANASFEDIGTTAESTIDLGGGALGSAGGNCLDGGALGAAVIGYDVSARHNWWGGPVRGTAAGGTLDTEPALSEAPARCTR
jgi:hypothetical protein